MFTLIIIFTASEFFNVEEAYLVSPKGKSLPASSQTTKPRFSCRQAGREDNKIILHLHYKRARVGITALAAWTHG
jgi:hypothetical protein